MKQKGGKRLLLPAILLIFMTSCATVPPGGAKTAPADLPVITDVQIGNNSLTLRSNKNFVYTIYNRDPYSVTLEIPDMGVGSFTEKLTSDKPGITEVFPRQIDSPSRAAQFDIILQSPATIVPTYMDKTLLLTLRHEEPVALTEMKEEAAAPERSAGEVKKAASEQSSATPVTPSEEEKPAERPATPAEPARESSVLPEATEIKSVKLEKADDALKVVITGNGTMTPKVFPLSGRIVVDIPGVSLHTRLPKAVSSPLKGIRAGRYGDKVRLVLDLRGKTPYDVTTRGDSVEISLEKKGLVAEAPPRETPSIKEKAHRVRGLTEEAPRAELSAEAGPREEASKSVILTESEKRADGRYRGKKISLDFQDADIGPIFRLLADVNGYNLVLDPSVKGRITIKLMNVPWDQALDIILNTFNLGKSIEGNILWIAPASMFQKIAEERAKEKEVVEKTEDLVQEVIRINYASSSDLSGAITQGKLLSPRGSITIDSRMNTLIVKDTPSSIQRIKELIKIMDVTKPQVMIEAKLVQVGTNYTESLGIRWGGTFATQTWPTTLGGNFSVNTPTVEGGPSTTNPGGVLNMSVGHANGINVNLSLSALESIGKSRTLSNPKVLTMDNEAATIQQGRTFYIATVSQAGTQTQQQTATLSLTVTPKITPDGYVQLKVTATDNSLEPNTLGGSPVVDTKSLTTQALVKNGETLVLGGIYTLDETETEEGVPVLNKIPLFGWLFKTRDQNGPNVKELLIFITPTIIGQQM